ncbi:metallophosphoesterase [Streptomyces sp. WAC06614]|uniref:metallophosphoesterase family protein n=1 Tax=Streptomyces sp. WAC06614 TaxID=2487416 RepID=UPI000F7A127E|nr:metallophosphoesterase [Streptomyces sp. WAC06614]RSS81661.1 metallophosphoesterase [Streptomyces sp. WAC06614]
MDVQDLRRHAAALLFTPQEPVRWMAPKELARTAVKVGLAAVFADYADKREIQGALQADLLRAPSADPDAEEIWIDFAADLGDGFESTYSLASVLAAPALDVAGAGAPLPRGSLLVLGGDQVYPVASTTAYEDRMKGPYRAALPSAPDRPLMVVLPGNHDWYDGLTAFLRMFAQGRPIGGWETRQTRSYFAVELPGRWWLVGLDSQLGSYFDDPQLRYFESTLSPRLRPGDSVIVCSAAPTWVKTEEDPNAFNSLHWFDRNIVRTRVDRSTGERTATGASIRLWLTGDKHHYARYAERLPEDPAGSGEGDGEGEGVGGGAAGGPPAADPRRRQMVTCGLGGAYLAATHRLPAVLTLPPAASRMREKDDPPPLFDRAPRTCPDAQESRALARGIATPWSRHWLPRRNPGFAVLAGAVQLVLVLLVSGVFALAEGRRHPVDAVRHAGPDELLALLCTAAAFFVLPFVLGWAGGLLRGRRPRAPSGPFAAVLFQLAVAVVALGLGVAVAGLVPAGWHGFWILLILLVVGALTGAVLGSQLFALWVLCTDRGQVAEWQMSGQSIDDRTGFVRMHIARDGTLTLHPLVLDGTCRDWRLEEVADPTAAWLRPVPAELLTVRPVEEPVVIAPTQVP